MESNYSLNETPSSLNPEKIHVQMNNYDFYSSKPSPVLDTKHGKSLPLNHFETVPVIRVFGSLPSGHQVLCHIHGVFPYIYIRYDGDIRVQSSSAINQKCTQLHTLLESRLQQSSARNKKNSRAKNNAENKQMWTTEKSSNKGCNGNAIIGNLQYIADVSIVKGTPFYGYHVGWTTFYKISLLKPSFVNKLSDMLRDGKIFEEKIETFESHIPYLLQFSADFNLFGCSWVILTECYFRRPVLNTILDIDSLMFNEELQRFLDSFVSKDNQNILPQNIFKRTGNGLLEIDIIPSFIENRKDLTCRDLHNNFMEKLGFEPQLKQKQYVSSTKQMVQEMKEQRKLYGLEKYKAALEVDRLMDQQPIWQANVENEDLYKKAVRNTKSSGSRTPKFETFVNSEDFFKKIPRPFESLGDLWPIKPTIINTREDTTSTNSVLENSTEDYVIPHLSDEEVEINDPINLVSVQKQKSTKGGWDNSSLEDISSVELASELSANDKMEKFSLDVQLTQNMALKRRKNLLVINKSEISATQKKRNFLISKRSDRLKPKNGFAFKKLNLTYNSILTDLSEQGFPIVNYKDPYFSNPLDLEDKPYVYAGKRFEVTSSHLSDKIPIMFNDQSSILETKIGSEYFSSWKYLKKPPSYKQLDNIAKLEELKKKARKYKSQIEIASNKDKYLYKFGSGSKVKKSGSNIHTALTHLSLEIHVDTREGKRPDPLHDQVTLIFWCLEDETYPFDMGMDHEGILALNKDLESSNFSKKIEIAASPLTVAFYETEFDMFDALTDLILLFDPDVLSGFELHMSSWGYILERCTKIHKFNIVEEISRVTMNWNNKSRDIWGYTHSSGIIITGRHMLNVWRILRQSFSLSQYTIENLAYHVLHHRLPKYSFEALTNMCSIESSTTSLKTLISYWMTRVRFNIQLLRKDDFIARTTEFSRLLGIDFHSVYYRGSQYKVESFLIRVCKSESFMLLSPSKQQVRGQKPLECVPLVMEPQSAFYKSPLVVLDFQSLYPSIMIAYNYCYSTMIGHVDSLKLRNNEIGVTSIHLAENILELLKNDISISPNGMVFAKSSVRKSTLAKMLTEILDIRVMVKKTMSDLKDANQSVLRQLNNKQLALKLLANVTYGYASASFSGRMPCSDLADSIVQTGRETLENAITFIENNDSWGAKVVYGDTDSLFVYLPGRTKEDAFRIGYEMSKGVTEINPKPIFLKFEKVYHPSVLVSKKRYVGYSYEHRDQKSPIFDSKGIETVRRDGHPAQQKIVEKSLRILFDSSDLSKVKLYVQNQFALLYQNKVSIKDFCFAKEVKLGTYKSEKTAPPGAVVATRLADEDHRAEPQYKERVPYVVVKGKQSEILRNRSVSPQEFMSNPNFELDADYYIDKTLVPPLSRLFNIMGINVAEWKQDLRRSGTKNGLITNDQMKNIGTSFLCSICGSILNESNDKKDVFLCEKCQNDSKSSTVKLLTDMISRQQELKNIETVCRACSYQYTKDAGIEGDFIASKCESFDCPIFYSRIKANKYLMDDTAKKNQHSLNFLNHW